MPRKVARSLSLMDVDGDEDLSQKNRAPESDDQELEAYAKAVAEFKVTWQKQKKEKETKFLKAARAELDAHIDRKRAEVQGIVDDMEATYQNFLSKEAAIEGQRRDAVVKIGETLKTLVSLSVRKHQATVELTLDLEEGQHEGIKRFKQACQEFADMVDALSKV